MDASQLVEEHPHIRDSGLYFLGTIPKPNDPGPWLHKREQLLISLHRAVDAATRLPGVLKSKQVRQLQSIIEKIDFREPPTGYGLVVGGPGHLRTFAPLDPLRPDVVPVVPREPTPEEILKHEKKRAKKHEKWLESQKAHGYPNGEFPENSPTPQEFRTPFRIRNPQEFTGRSLTADEEKARRVDLILTGLEMRRERLKHAFKHTDWSEYPQLLAMREELLRALDRKLDRHSAHNSPSQVARIEKLRRDIGALQPLPQPAGYLYPRFVAGGQPTLGKGRR